MDPSSLPPLRREAHPFEWQNLTRQQKGAIERVAALLMDALEVMDSKISHEPSPLVSERRSQLAFVDGDRGMGKTSVLLAIHRLMRDDAPPAGLPTAVSTLHGKRDRLVWLETLDMEPLPRTANLLAAILARIGEQLEGPTRRPLGRAAAVFEDLDDHEKVASELQQLTVDAVLAWQGAEPRRADRIEPTTYAEEVLTSERAGLHLNSRLHSVLSGLAKLSTLAGKIHDPLFIIPVDDFDLAATRCLELLRIIRMVSSPRLFFVVAGNTRIAETVLRLQSEGDLASVAGDRMTNIEAVSIRLAATEIAANNLRKLVPPEQRARLSEVLLGEALEFCAASGSPSLVSALTAITFDRNNAGPEGTRCSLSEFVLESKTSTDGKREPPTDGLYSAAAWLGGKPRQVLDRTALFHSERGYLTERAYGESLLRALAEDLHSEAREDARLEFELRERFGDVIDTRQGIRLHFSRVFTLAAERVRYQLVEGAASNLIVGFPSGSEWRFRSPDAESRQRTEADEWVRRVPAHLAAGLTFLHDLAISLWGGYVLPHSMPDEGAQHFAPVAVRWHILPDDDTPIHWHVPGWWTIREYECFCMLWEAQAKELSSVDEFAAGWLAAMLEVVMDVPHVPGVEGRAWKRLLDMLNALAMERPERFSRCYLRESVLVVVALLLAPESGCSGEPAMTLLKAKGDFVKALQGEAVARRVRAWRAGRFVATRNLLRRSDRAIDRSWMPLLSSISHEEVVAMVVSEARRSMESGRHRLSSDEMMASRNGQEMLPILERLRSNSDLKDEELGPLLAYLERGNADEIGGALRAAIEARGNRHAINELGRGLLVPSHEDIASITNVQQPFPRRYP